MPGVEQLLRLAHRSDGGGSARRPTRRRDAGERLPRQVEPVGHETQGLLALGRVLGLREDLPGAHERLLPVGGALELQPHAIVQIALRLPEPLLEAVGRIGGILSGREHDDADLEALAVGPLHPAERRVLAGRIGVEAEVQPLGQARELAEMMLGQSGAHRGDDRLEPRLPQCDHVGVALDHDGAVLLRDRRPGEMEPVEDIALLEQLALGRVDVLALERVVVVELPRLEADHPARARPPAGTSAAAGSSRCRAGS